MTIQKATRYLEALIEQRKKVLEIIKKHLDKMTSDHGKYIGKTILEINEKDLVDLQQILAELQPRGVKSDTKRKKKSL